MNDDLDRPEAEASDVAVEANTKAEDLKEQVAGIDDRLNALEDTVSKWTGELTAWRWAAGVVLGLLAVFGTIALQFSVSNGNAVRENAADLATVKEQVRQITKAIDRIDDRLVQIAATYKVSRKPVPFDAVIALHVKIPTPKVDGDLNTSICTRIVFNRFTADETVSTTLGEFEPYELDPNPRQWEEQIKRRQAEIGDRLRKALSGLKHDELDVGEGEGDYVFKIHEDTLNALVRLRSAFPDAIVGLQTVQPSPSSVDMALVSAYSASVSGPCVQLEPSIPPGAPVPAAPPPAAIPTGTHSVLTNQKHQ